MAKRLIEESTLTDIANAIRQKSGKNELIDPINYGEEIRNIPSSGVDFLSIYVEELNKKNDWRYGFAGAGWTDSTFNPSQRIEVPRGTNVRFLFQIAQIENITLSDIDLRQASDLRNLFDGCSKLKNLEFNNGNAPFQSTTFAGCTALENLMFSNTIEVNGLNLEDCTSLTEQSTVNVLVVLSPDPSIASGKSVTMPIHTKQWTDVEGSDANTALRWATEAGWTVAFN